MKLSFTKRLAIMVICPVIVVSVIMLYFGFSIIKKTTYNEMQSTLHSTVVGLQQTLNASSSGNFSCSDGKLLKGNVDITGQPEIFTNLKKVLGADVSLYLGDNIMISTIEGAVGTVGDEEVKSSVLYDGKEYFSNNVHVKKIPYYGYYIPIKNSSQKIIGMIFAGKPVFEVSKDVNAAKRNFIIIALIVIVVNGIVLFFVAGTMVKALSRTRNVVHEMSEGNLQITFNESGLKRKDEIGSLYRRAKSLKESMAKIISKIQNASNELSGASQNLYKTSKITKDTSGYISQAMEEVADGANSQSIDMQKANESVAHIGNLIKEVVFDVEQLIQMADSMNQLKKSAERNISQLNQSNEKSLEAVQKIEKQIDMTNDSVNYIKNTISIIHGISDQTNLLSLNASIEAARAGEAGKGFAVVASEIKLLAEQSNQSTKAIQKRIDELLVKSEAMVEIMAVVNGTMLDQNKDFINTMQQFIQLGDGISKTVQGINAIKDLSVKMDSEKGEMIDTIQSLSAVSEENAANTEQTMASVQELNATMEELAEQSKVLDNIAKMLIREVSVFRI